MVTSIRMTINTWQHTNIDTKKKIEENNSGSIFGLMSGSR